MKVSVDKLAAKFHFRGGVSDEGDTALTAVGVTGELEVERTCEVEVIEGVWFMDEGDDRFIFFVPFPRSGGGWPTGPDGVESIDKDVFTFDVKFGGLVLEVGHAGSFDFLAEVRGGAMPAVVVPGAGDDSLGG